jgi:hypothetical protein
VKRVSLWLLAVLVLAAVVLPGCTGGPKERVDDFVAYLPDAIGPWTLADSVKLQANTVTSIGHVALTYTGPDGAIAFLVIESHPTGDAAEVALASRERELILDGLEFSKDREPQKATADVTAEGRVRYAFFHQDDLLVEIDALAAADADPVSDEDFGALMDIVREVLTRMVQD